MHCVNSLNSLPIHHTGYRKLAATSLPERGGDFSLKAQEFRFLKIFDKEHGLARTATADSDVVQSGRPIFDDFFQHLWPYIANNTANVVFQRVKHLWLIRIDQ
ncbi:hypothetical protein TNCV_2287801 [Trichonephila clavipes]|nr:hypothetical protein TNCV_2287801 [Trichonephila clavipes]